MRVNLEVKRNDEIQCAFDFVLLAERVARDEPLKKPFAIGLGDKSFSLGSCEDPLEVRGKYIQ